MNKLVLAAIAATVTLAVAAPAMAQEEHHDGRVVKKVIMHRDHDRDRDRDHRWREGRRHHDRKVVVIKHRRDRDRD